MKERGILMPLLMNGNESAVMCTTTWLQSLRCLLTIFDPDGVGQNPLDFSPFHRARFKDESLKTSARPIDETNF